MHAGEAGGEENVKMAVQEYGATRIGHGYRIVRDSKLMEEMRGVHFEICPTSSVETGGWVYKMRNWNEHPAVQMIRSGMKVGFNSDDPAGKNMTHVSHHRFLFPPPWIHTTQHSPYLLFSLFIVWSVFDTSLTWQLRVALGKMGLSKKCLLQAAHNSIDAAFLNPEEKDVLRRRLIDFTNTSIDRNVAQKYYDERVGSFAQHEMEES
jgi:adenosine deaminase